LKAEAVKGGRGGQFFPPPSLELGRQDFSSLFLMGGEVGGALFVYVSKKKCMMSIYCIVKASWIRIRNYKIWIRILSLYHPKQVKIINKLLKSEQLNHTHHAF